MGVNWSMIYRKSGPLGWYAVHTPFGKRYMMMVNMDDILVSLPFFSYGALTKNEADVVDNKVEFTFDGKQLTCNDPKVRWHVRMLRPVSEHLHTVKVVS